MINLTKKINPLLNMSAFILVISIVLLQSCGGERTTPFNPSSSSSSSSVTSVTINKIANDISTHITINHKEKSLQVMRDETEFFKIVNDYVNSNISPTPDFVAGQVVLIDMGETDECAKHLTLSSLTAQLTGTNSVKVIVNYSEKPAISSCTANTDRPFFVYHINSRDLITFSEVIE